MAKKIKFNYKKETKKGNLEMENVNDVNQATFFNNSTWQPKQPNSNQNSSAWLTPKQRSAGSFKYFATMSTKNIIKVYSNIVIYKNGKKRTLYARAYARRNRVYYIRDIGELVDFIDIVAKLKRSMKKYLQKITRHSEESEKALERYLIDKVRMMGGLCLKYSNAGMTGYPDRVCLMPGGVTLWVELKSKGEKPKVLQQARFDKMAGIGHPVHVCASKPDIDEVLKPYKSAQL